MSRLPAGLCAALLLALCFSPRPSSGQTVPAGTPTATPVPTATAAPSPTPGHQRAPSGAKLLALSLAATERAGSYHAVARSVIWIAGRRQRTSLMVADRVTRSQREHTVETDEVFGQAHRPIIRRAETFEVGQFIATRHPGGAWDCVNLNAPTPAGNGASGAIKVVVVRGGITEIQQTKSLAVRELAPTTVNGIPVWHLRLVAKVRPPGGPLRYVDDDFISQVDYTLRRQVTSFGLRVAGHGEEMTTRFDYSHYGYPYHIALPKACAVFHGLFRPMGPPAALLLRQGLRAVQRNTLHMDSRTVITVPGKLRSITIMRIDQRRHLNWVHMIWEMRRIRPGHPPRVVARQREETISLRSGSAVRENNGPWRCAVAEVEFELFERTAGRGRVVGEAYVDGTPTWRIHTRVPSKAGISHTVDDYVSVHGHRLIRSVDRKVDRTTKPLTRTVEQTDYTRYGEPIRVALPPSCRG